jgi:hypothetical protein
MPNYIKKLQTDNAELEQRLRDALEAMTELQLYLLSPKFHVDDYVHVRTDILPKLASLKNLLN